MSNDPKTLKESRNQDPGALLTPNQQKMNHKMTAAEAAHFLGVSVQSIHKQLKTKNLPHQKSQNRVFFGFETARRLFEINFKSKAIAFQIVKGGTGKTSIAHAVAIRANLYGARVICIDMDQQGNLTQAFGVNAEKLPVMIDVVEKEAEFNQTIIQVAPGIDLIPSRIENAAIDNSIMLKKMPLQYLFKDEVKKLRRRYDLIIFDCPPALGQSVAAVALVVDTIIAPVTPEEFSLSGLKVTDQELKNLETTYKSKINFRLILNKFNTTTNLSHEVLSRLIKHQRYGEMLFKSYIRTSQEFANTIHDSISIYDTLKNTAPKEDIDLLTREILELNAVKSNKEGISLGNLETTKISAAV